MRIADQESAGRTVNDKDTGPASSELGAVEDAPATPRCPRARGSRPAAASNNQPHRETVTSSLLVGILAGFGMGAWLALAAAGLLPPPGNWLALTQAHGQAQLLGFTALFVVGVGVNMFPRFLAAPFPRTGPIRWAAALAGAGLLLRMVVQPQAASPVRLALLLLAGLLVPFGLGAIARAFLPTVRRSRRRGEGWATLVLSGLATYLVCSLLYAISTWWLAVSGSSFLPLRWSEALDQVELMAGAVPIIFGVSAKVFSRLLLLQPPQERVLRPALVALLVGTWITAVGWFFTSALILAFGQGLALAGVALCVLALRVYHRPRRASLMPHVTNPTRLWLRLAYGWLLFSAALGYYLALRMVVLGIAIDTTTWSAGRHALTQGFLTVMIAVMAGRILPGYPSLTSRWRWLLPSIVWLLQAGALARVGGELFGGYQGLAGPVIGLGSTLCLVGFLLFALTVLLSLWAPDWVAAQPLQRINPVLPADEGD